MQSETVIMVILNIMVDMVIVIVVVTVVILAPDLKNHQKYYAKAASRFTETIQSHGLSSYDPLFLVTTINCYI